MGKFIDELSDVVKDISDDISQYQDVEEPTYPLYRRRVTGAGPFRVFLPNIIGFVLGLAITRMFGMGGAMYLILGNVGSMIFGVYHCVADRKMSYGAALIRNLVIIVVYAIFFAIAVLLTKTRR